MTLPGNKPCLLANAGKAAAFSGRRNMTIWRKIGLAVAAMGRRRPSVRSGACGRRGAPDGGRAVPEPGLFVMPAGGGQCSGRSAVARTCSRSRSRSTIGTGSAGRTRSRSPPGQSASTPMRGRMGRDGVYTPQVVVNGRVEGDGLEPGALAGLMSRGDRGAGGPSIGFSGGAVTVGGGRRAGRRGRRVACALYSRTRSRSRFRAARTAAARCPTRTWCAKWSCLGKWRGEAATFPAPGGDPGLAEAAIVQASGAGPILAAAKR